MQSGTTANASKFSMTIPNTLAEREYAELLGPRRYANLSNALALLLDGIDPSGGLDID